MNHSARRLAGRPGDLTSHHHNNQQPSTYIPSYPPHHHSFITTDQLCAYIYISPSSNSQTTPCCHGGMGSHHTPCPPSSSQIVSHGDREHLPTLPYHHQSIPTSPPALVSLLLFFVIFLSISSLSNFLHTTPFVFLFLSNSTPLNAPFRYCLGSTIATLPLQMPLLQW